MGLSLKNMVLVVFAVSYLQQDVKAVYVRGQPDANPAPHPPSYHPGNVIFPELPKQPLTLLDKILARIHDVQALISKSSEVLTALEARAAVQREFLDKIELTIGALQNVDNNQNAAIDNLQEHIDLANANLDTLDQTLSNTSSLIEDNADGIEALSIRVAAADKVSTFFVLRVVDLARQASDLAEKLLSYTFNKFNLRHNTLKELTGDFKSIKEIALSKSCEVLEVTLEADDRRAELQFQREFPHTPQILTGIKGFKSDLNARDTPLLNAYVYPLIPRDPSALGVMVSTYASPSSVTVEKEDLGFGNGASLTLDVEVLACSIGPGF